MENPKIFELFEKEEIHSNLHTESSHFGKEEFSKGEIKAVLNDLRHYTPNSQSFPTYTSYQNEEYKRIKESQYYNPLTRTMGFRKDEPI